MNREEELVIEAEDLAAARAKMREASVAEFSRSGPCQACGCDPETHLASATDEAVVFLCTRCGDSMKRHCCVITFEVAYLQ